MQETVAGAGHSKVAVCERRFLATTWASVGGPFGVHEFVCNNAMEVTARCSVLGDS